MDVFSVYFGLFANSFLSATLLPLSSEPLFVAMLSWHFSPFWCISIASLGNNLGGLTNLLLGRGSRSFFEKRSTKKPYAERFIRQYGAWVAWLSWVPFVGDPLLVAAGYYRTPLGKTILFMVIGKTTRYVVLWYLWSLTQ